jgi:undecaprenyl diphosphate synthase
MNGVMSLQNNLLALKQCDVHIRLEDMTEYTKDSVQNSPTPPICIGIIMDGNRRWAKKHELPTYKGHMAGKDTLKHVIEWASEAGVQHLICYAFSTENWTRPKEEVVAIEQLLIEGLKHEVEELAEKGIKLRFIGERGRFSEETQTLMTHAEEVTSEGRHTLGVALSYGGRAEIVQAAQCAAQSGVVSEESLAQSLWTTGIPDPELIIRTGGQERLSNFLLWQSAYSELWFTDTLWPDFSKEEFLKALVDFEGRKRNFGA